MAIARRSGSSRSDGCGRARQLTLGARQRPPPALLPGRPHARLHLRPPDRRRGGALRPVDPKDREDASQVHLLPLDGGEARRLTDLPRGVERLRMVARWDPAGRRQRVARRDPRRGRPPTRHRPATRGPGPPPPSDYRFIDRLEYMLNGAGFTYDRVGHLWLVDVATGEATRLTDGPVADHEPAWSPDGRRIAFSSNRRRDADLWSTAPGHPRRRCRDARRDRRDPRSAIGVPGADLAPGRPDDRRARPPDDRPRRQPQRHLALRRRRVAMRRRAAVATSRRRHDLMPGSGDGQRRDPRRGTSARAVAGRPLAAFQRADRRRLRAVADRGRRWPAGATDQGTPLRLELARGPEPARPSPRDPDRLPPFDPDPAARPVAGRGRGLGRAATRAASPPSTPTSWPTSRSTPRSNAG